jgi:hypothetical protein
MTEKTDPRTPPSQAIQVTASPAEAAPFIYFDRVASFGINFGVVQMELAANVIFPQPNGGAQNGAVFTAHQQGHRGMVLTSALIRRARMVAIELGMWRSGRKGGCSGSTTFG